MAKHIPGFTPGPAFDCKANDDLFGGMEATTVVAPPPAPVVVKEIPAEQLLPKMQELWKYLETLRAAYAGVKSESYRAQKTQECLQHQATVVAAGLFIKARQTPQSKGGSEHVQVTTNEGHGQASGAVRAGANGHSR